MSFVGNMSGMNEDEEVDMQITYNDPLDTTKNFSQDRLAPWPSDGRVLSGTGVQIPCLQSGNHGLPHHR